MDAADELEHIAQSMAGILRTFRETRDGLWIADGDEARLAGWVLDARDLLRQSLGPENDFGSRLQAAKTAGTYTLSGSQNYHSVEQCMAIVAAGARAVRRATSERRSNAAPPEQPYVSSNRIAELRAAPTSPWDLSRLVRMCEELNSVFAGGNYLATAMIVRAILDHVPPIFGANTFNEYASSVAGRSVKASMQQLQQSHRNIADRWLHEKIERDRHETLPDGPQVDRRADLSVLLGEVVRAASGSASSEA